MERLGISVLSKKGIEEDEADGYWMKTWLSKVNVWLRLFVWLIWISFFVESLKDAVQLKL